MATKTASYRDRLMKGRVRVETKASSNIVRVFLSSTFADMSDERNVLYNKAYPELRNFCQNLGLEFQAIDMRWGVRDTASVDHSTTALCLLEVKTCKKVSLGPYFVVFFGNRYGYQPLPNAIKDSEFTVLYQILEGEGLGQESLLDRWYKLDRNNLPPARILEPITNHFPHFDDTNPEFAEKRDADREGWNEVFKDLSGLLKNASESGAKRGLLPQKCQFNFKKSITHMEVEEALEEHGDGILLAYNREISDIRKHTKEDKANLFIDLVENEKIDRSKQKMLRSLKRMVKLQTDGKKVFKRYEVTWNNLSKVQQDEKLQGGYLQKFCEDFVSDMKTSIVNGLSVKEEAKKNETTEDALLEEIVHHARFEYLKTVDFCGREKLIGDISDLIASTNNHHPIVLVGTSGCGKTSLFAKLVEVQRSRSQDSVIVYRFLGTSPDSSNIHKLLTSLILQISAVYRKELPASHLLQNFTDVVEHFAKLLHWVSKRLGDKADESLIIFLDSIDQLSLEDGAHRMTWLPKTTPDKVTIVLSSLPEPDFDIVPTMRRYLPESNIHTVHGLTVGTAKEILQKCLSSEGRQLTDPQTVKILTAFEKSPFPLFLKLMLEEAKRWRSYDDLEGLELPESARSAISRFFERLEKEHGSTFTSRAIGYIVAARDGVTENELQDLLSLDDEVMNDVYEHWSPPLENSARIPPFTWTRLNYDLSKYIVQRQATGHTVLALYHRQFIEVAREKYLQLSDTGRVYGNLSQYFQGLYAGGTPKRLKLKMWEESREVDRGVAKQPNQFARDVFNVRKLRELPFCLLKAKSYSALRDAVLGNPEWIQTKIKAFSIKEVLDDYNMVLNEIDDPEIRLIRDALKLAKPTLEFPGVRNHLFAELFCRLKFFCDQFPDCLGGLVNRSRDLLEKKKDEVFLPLNGCFQPPGGPLRTTITGLKTPVTCLEFLYEENIFAAGSRDGHLMVWDTKNDEVVHKIEAHSAPVMCVAYNESKMGDKVASCSRDKSVKMYYLDNGNQCFSEVVSDLETANFTKLVFTKEQLVLITDFKMVIWNTVTKEQIFTKEFNSASICAHYLESKQEKYVILGHADGSCQSLNLNTGEKTASTDERGDSVKDIFSLVEGEESSLVAVWQRGRISLLDTNSLLEKDISEGIDEDVIDTCRSRFGRNFAVAFSRTVKVFSSLSGKIEIVCCLVDYDNTMSKVRFVGNTELAVAYDNQKVVLWDFADAGNPVRSNIWEGMGAPIDHMEIGGKVGVTGSDKVFYLKVWDLKHQDAVKLDPVLPLYPDTSTLSSSGKVIAYIENGKIVVRAISDSSTIPMGDKQVINGFDGKDVRSMKFHGKGDDLLIAKGGLVVKLHREEGGGIEQTGTEQARFDDSESEIQLLSTSSNCDAVTIVSESKDGEASLKRLNGNDLSLVWRLDLSAVDMKGSITAVCCAEEITLVGTSEGYLYVVTDPGDKENGIRIKIGSSKHGNALTCLAISNSGKLIFSGSKGRTRRIWEFRDGDITLKHELHLESLLQGGVTSAQFTHDDKFVVSGSKERAITLWDCQTGDLVGSQYVYAPVLDVVVTEVNKLIYTSELGYVAVAEFRPTAAEKNTSSKIKRDQSKSSSCRVM